MLAALVWDNPLFIKHTRASLRTPQILPAMIGVALVAVCLCYFGIMQDQAAEMLGCLIAGQGVLLLLLGSSKVISSVTQARDSGVLDFHRISPQSPAALTLGFLLGGPIREYLLFACTLPFSVVLAIQAHLSGPDWLTIECELLVVALLYHTMAMIVGLSMPTKSANSVIALYFFLHVMAQIIPVVSYLTVLPTVITAMTRTSAFPMFSEWGWFMGVQLSPFVVSLLHQLPLLAFLFVAAMRKTRRPLAPPFSKLTAVAFYATVAVLGLGEVAPHPSSSPWSTGMFGIGEIALLYALALAGVCLCFTITPSAGEFLKGLRQARKLGQSRLSVWSDLAANETALALLALVCALGGAAVALSAGAYGAGPAQVGLAALIGVCAVLFFGAIKQSFDLLFRKRNSPYLGLLVFIVWGLPVLVAVLLMASGLEEGAGNTVLALSPITALGLICSQSTPPSAATLGLAVSVILAVAAVAFDSWAIRRTIAAESAEGGDPAAAEDAAT